MAESTEKAAKNKKINKLKAADIDTKLNELRTSQGGLKSGYAIPLSHPPAVHLQAFAFYARIINDLRR